MRPQPNIDELLQLARATAEKLESELELRQQDIATQSRYAEGVARIAQARSAAIDVLKALDQRRKEA